MRFKLCVLTTCALTKGLIYFKYRMLNINFTAKGKEWQCYCIYSVAQNIVLDLRQEKEYCRCIVLKFRPEKRKHKYKFGDDQQESIIYIAKRIPIEGYQVVRLNVDIPRIEKNTDLIFCKMFSCCI